MKQLLLAVVTALATACDPQPGLGQHKIPTGNPDRPASGEAVATFAEGCFWHSEIIFQSLKGVRDAVSGYAGGHTKNPTYETVGTGQTGHAESVQVYYDPAVISFRTLVQAFFASQDPTQANGQGPDQGTQYRSIAFYRSPQEKKIIEEEIARIKATGKYRKPIATELLPLGEFYPAERYHQEFVAHHPNQPYVRSVSIPDYEHFRRTFPGPFKD
ncbi:peptide-methionine (S)-S-oxide reductase [Flaviaesturariibacter terrae]